MAILQSVHHQFPNRLVEDLKKANCGFEGRQALVCCPFDLQTLKENFHRVQTTEKPWIWDVVSPTPNPHRNHVASFNNGNNQNFFHNRFSTENLNQGNTLEYVQLNHYDDFVVRPHQNIQKLHFYFHFEDPKTMRNHPPSISPEFQLPGHLQDVMPFKVTHPVPLPWHQTTAAVNSFTPTPMPSAGIFDQSTTMPSAGKSSLINGPLCGLTINSRIIGGKDAGPGQFPWIARLAYRNASELTV